MSDYTNATDVASHPYDICTEVSTICPVTATTLGYYPNAGANNFFAVMFGLAMVVTVATGAWKRTWNFSLFVAAGTALELVGYAARVPLQANPWNMTAFEAQICAIVLAPTLVCISIYLTLKHVCLALCPGLSRLRPSLYPWLFVPSDISCLLVQGIGGGLAAAASYTNAALLASGNRTIIAGIAMQVVVLGFFGLTALDYYVRLRRWIRSGTGTGTGAGGSSEAAPTVGRHGVLLPPPGPEALALWHDRHFRMFMAAITVAYACILTRCIYRIIEMAGGWGNIIMQDEPSFMVLEAGMLLIAVWTLALFPPGFLFPNMAANRKPRKAKSATAADAAAAEAASDGHNTGDFAAAADAEGEKSKSTPESADADDLEAGAARAQQSAGEK